VPQQSPTVVTGIKGQHDVVHRRRWGTWASGAFAVAVGALVVLVASRAQIEYSVIPEYFFSEVVLSGLGNTLILAGACMAIGIALGILAAVMRQSPSPVARTVSALYVWAFRGTPVLVQLLLWFNLSLVIESVTIPGVGERSTNDLMTPFLAAVLALGINEGSYMAEIIRGGILSVGRGQHEAAQALGISRGRTMFHIVLPQALRVIVPPTGNEFITMLKYTSLAYVVSYTELLGAAYKIYSTNLKVVELLITVSIWYLLITTVLSVGQRQLERRLSAADGRGPGTGARTRRPRKVDHDVR
jgi:polar amino acid transport system permease protein